MLSERKKQRGEINKAEGKQTEEAMLKEAEKIKNRKNKNSAKEQTLNVQTPNQGTVRKECRVALRTIIRKEHRTRTKETTHRWLTVL